ncbi:MAG: response regulator [Archangium sp.]|nr:response regulator [Archangium sp.]
MSKTDPRVLIVDADGEAAQRIGVALDSAGLAVSWTTFAPKEFASLAREFQPTLLLVHSELGSAQLATLLARSEASATGSVPVALLCKDVSDEPFVRPLREGIVEMMQEPFTPRLHISRLRDLLTDLPQRPGKLRGKGGANELNALLQHVMRTRRTGGLVVGEGTPSEGRAFFMRGVLRAARFQNHTMQPALAAMSRAQQPWTFSEGTDGSSLVELNVEGDSGLFARTPETSDDAALGDAVVPVSAPAVPPLVDQPSTDPDAARTPVLLVDDEPAVVSMLSTYLAKKGYPVFMARDGVEALGVLVSKHVEVVIADLNMPRLDGWGLLRMIREDVRTHEIPVALFSAQDDYRETLRLMHAGAQAYFPKSLKLAALELQVRELAEPRRRFLRMLSTDGGLTYDFGALGPQWVLRTLSSQRFTGQLDARDAWATWRGWFEAGRLIQMSARVGATTLAGDRALAGFLSSKQASGSLSKGLATRPGEEGFGRHPTEATLDRLVPWLNDEQKRSRDATLQKAKALVVHDELYRLYLAVGPPAGMPIARLLCEQKITPGEVIQRLQCTPAEVAAVVQDLLRRGVASLQ